MCGRFCLTASKNEIQERFHITMPDWKPNYNCAPSQKLPVILDSKPEFAEYMPWGIEFPWKKMINFRAETVAGKFRWLLKRRCLVINDGFYEWKGKQPHRFSTGLSTFAGVYDKGGFVIITTEANATVNPIHKRMPVILSKKEEKQWLSGHVEDVIHLMKPYSGRLKEFQVSMDLNSVRNNTPALVLPIESLS